MLLGVDGRQASLCFSMCARKQLSMEFVCAAPREDLFILLLFASMEDEKLPLRRLLACSAARRMLSKRVLGFAFAGGFNEALIMSPVFVFSSSFFFRGRVASILVFWATVNFRFRISPRSRRRCVSRRRCDGGKETLTIFSALSRTSFFSSSGILERCMIC